MFRPVSSDLCKLKEDKASVPVARCGSDCGQQIAL